MKKRCLIFVASSLILFLLTGCGSYLRLNEKEIYFETVDSFFEALDAGDKNELESLFSKTVLCEDDDLSEQIDRLVSIYPRSTTTVLFDGALGGEYTDEGGMFSSMAYTTLPVVVDDEYYWVYMELIYEDDFSSDNIGLNRVGFYTADEYYLDFHTGSGVQASDVGLMVYAEQDVEMEIRCINGCPYAYTPSTQLPQLSEVEKFLAVNTDLSAFTAAFGQPNAKGISVYYYETQDDGYLEIGVQHERIVYVYLVDDASYIRCILEEK